MYIITVIITDKLIKMKNSKKKIWLQTDETSKAGEKKTIQSGPKMRTLKTVFQKYINIVNNITDIKEILPSVVM